MVRELGLQRSLQDCFGELFQQAVLADDVFRLLVIGQQLINEGLVDSHRFLILLFRWSFTQLLLQLPCPDVTPSRTSPVVPEILLGNVQHLFGTESPPQDRQHSGRLLRHPLPPSCARHQPRDRRGNEGTRWRSAVMPLLLAAYPVSSLPTGRLPILPPSTISGSGEVSSDRPPDAR